MSDYTVINHITVPEGCQSLMMTVPMKSLKESYIRAFDRSIYGIIHNKELTGNDIRIFFYILTVMEYDNILDIPQSKIATDLGIAQQDISKSIQKLRKADYLRIIGKIGRQNIYKVNPYIAFRSRANKYEKLCDDWDKLIDNVM